MVGLLSIRFFSLKGMIFFMPVYKNEQRGTWFTTFYYTDWTGTRKKKKKEGFTTLNEKPKPLSVNFSNVWRELAT